MFYRCVILSSSTVPMDEDGFRGQGLQTLNANPDSSVIVVEYGTYIYYEHPLERMGGSAHKPTHRNSSVHKLQLQTKDMES